jgi:AcrR family transcriptional regulator
MDQPANPRQPGRPRSDRADTAILQAVLEEVFSVGFREMSLDAVAQRAGVAKTTIYRRWPNKAAVVMDAFLARVRPVTEFPATERAIDSMRLQLRTQAKVFRGKYGNLVRSLLGEAQFDHELAKAFSERWRTPRRAVARQMFQRAIREGDLRGNIDIDTAIDMLYGPLYYRMQIDSGPISDAYVDSLFEHAISGLS